MYFLAGLFAFNIILDGPVKLREGLTLLSNGQTMSLNQPAQKLEPLESQPIQVSWPPAN